MVNTDGLGFINHYLRIMVLILMVQQWLILELRHHDMSKYVLMVLCRSIILIYLKIRQMN